MERLVKREYRKAKERKAQTGYGRNPPGSPEKSRPTNSIKENICPDCPKVYKKRRPL